MTDKKRSNISLVIIVLIIMTFVIGFAYAVFRAQLRIQNSEVDVGAKSIDILMYNISGDLSLNVTTSNLTSGGSSVIKNATGTISLTSKENGESASYDYSIYLNVTSNDLVYSVDNTTPELVLRVKKNNVDVTSITGLTYNSTLQGFDITTLQNNILIADDTITTTSNTIDTWSFEVEFVNLGVNQYANSNKHFVGEIDIDNKASA